VSEQPSIADLVAAATGERPVSVAPLSGGCIARVYRCTFADGRASVAKVAVSACSGPAPSLEPEGFMLTYLAQRTRLPVPPVRSCSDTLLVLDLVASDGDVSTGAERHAAELLADLHAISAPSYGLDRDTLIASISQPNPWSASWVAFFRDHRLLYLASLAAGAGRIAAATLRKIQSLAARLGELIPDRPTPALLHGDVWSGNVLVRSGRVAAFIDPAIYYGHAEVELAFIRLFSTFGAPFFHRYSEIRPIEPGFFGGREHLYNLYPLLVHAYLFGGHYEGEVLERLALLGF
jgi:fructosamine-3-kinase